MFVFRPDWMLEVLPVMGYGMLGIFLVTGILIGTVALLNQVAGNPESPQESGGSTAQTPPGQ